MAKYRVHAFYIISLKRDWGSYADDPSWEWRLIGDAAVIAEGSTQYRWTAVRAARRAARRDLKGKPPVKVRNPKPNLLSYPISTWKKL